MEKALRRRRLAARIACCAMLRLPDTGPIDKPAGGSNVCTACNVNFVTIADLQCGHFVQPATSTS